MCALDSYLVGVSLSFPGHVFLHTSWGYDIPTSAHSGITILLILFFSSVHTLRTIYDSSLGV
jgi:hypothetical protein